MCLQSSTSIISPIEWANIVIVNGIQANTGGQNMHVYFGSRYMQVFLFASQLKHCGTVA